MLIIHIQAQGYISLIFKIYHKCNYKNNSKCCLHLQIASFTSRVIKEHSSPKLKGKKTPNIQERFKISYGLSYTIKALRLTLFTSPMNFLWQEKPCLELLPLQISPRSAPRKFGLVSPCIFKVSSSCSHHPSTYKKKRKTSEFIMHILVTRNIVIPTKINKLIARSNFQQAKHVKGLKFQTIIIQKSLKQQ
ncbi:unnamed protein product [Vicia faba]|uniref:Uncharacterized protein n=1 Tax=Vicia faba TaxID=3906 RepID=A0AAV0Z3M8_VICFA|nr:unnamed protein product [Vicia faba]